MSRHRYDYDYYFISEGHAKALKKNKLLVLDYDRFKDEAWWYIGQKNVKLFLNKKIKEGDFNAYVYKTLLDIEGININAKKYRNTRSFSYKDNYYFHKRDEINAFIRKVYEYNKTAEEKIVFGIQKSNVMDTKSIFYVELPNAPSEYNQVSFHTDIDGILEPITPQYEREWDGLAGTTLDKLEKVVKTVYGEELKQKYGVDESGYCEKYRKSHEVGH